MWIFKKKQKTAEEEYTPEKDIKRQYRFFNWIQEYSKKIITIIFIMYVFINLYILSMIAIAYFRSGELQLLDTLIVETSTTFRDIIGGYLIKAATENAIKITGGVFDRYLEYKMMNIDTSEDTNDEENDDEEKGSGLQWKRQNT